MVEEKSSFI